MRKKIKQKNNGWKLSFALLPVKIGDTLVWLERYWSKEEALYTNVRLKGDSLIINQLKKQKI